MAPNRIIPIIVTRAKEAAKPSMPSLMLKALTKPTTAKIVNDTIILTVTDIQSPTVLRYASESDMGEEKLDVNLANAAGLPASPFTITIK